MVNSPEDISPVSKEACMLYLPETICIEKLRLGMTNENYVCTLRNGKKYVVRIPGEGSHYFVNRSEEEKILSQISTSGINVNSIRFDSDTGAKVTEYYENADFSRVSIAEKICHGAKLLKRTHQLSTRFDNDFDFWKQIKSYQSTCLDLNILIENDLRQILDKLMVLEGEILTSTPKKLPCHNDPVPENFLLTQNGVAFLIDWEYAGMNDPVWDLAAFSLEFGLTKGQETFFLSQYLESAPVCLDLIFRIKLYKIYQDLLWFVWSKIRINFGVHIQGYASGRFSRGKKNFENLVTELKTAIR